MLITDTELRLKGMNTLLRNLGEVEAERFITLIIREPFDYTQWQKNLWEEKGIAELSNQAMKYIKKIR